MLPPLTAIQISTYLHWIKDDGSFQAASCGLQRLMNKTSGHPHISFSGHPDNKSLLQRHQLSNTTFDA